MPHIKVSSLYPLLAAGCLFAFSATEASAQSNGLFGSSSPLSGSNGFSTGSTLSGMGSSMFGGSAMGGAGGMGATGQSGMGGMTGQTGMGGMGGQQGGGTGGQQGFIGRANGAGQFIGATNATNGQNRGRTQNNQLNRGGNGAQVNPNQNFQGQQQGANAGSARIIRPQQRVAFNYRLPSAERTDLKLTTRFDKLSKRLTVRGLDIAVDGTAVTLRGNVDSEETKRLAAMLVSLEPGVRNVKNELTVTPLGPEIK